MPQKYRLLLKIGNLRKIYKIFEKVYMARQQFKSELTFIPLLEECLRAFISVNSSLFESKTFHSPIWLGTPFDVALVVVDVEIWIWRFISKNNVCHTFSSALKMWFNTRAVDRILKSRIKSDLRSRIKSNLKSRIKSDLTDFLTGRKPLLLWSF